MHELLRFIGKHAIRSAYQCGKCFGSGGNSPDSPTHSVDIVFFQVSAQDDPCPDKLKELILASKVGEFGDVDLFDGKEHNYIELGGWIGDQGTALTLMGLGSLLGLWQLITPKTIPGFPDELVEMMAGQGFITVQYREG